MKKCKIGVYTVGTILLIATSGCTPAGSPPAEATNLRAPYLSAAELRQLLDSAAGPVLVEFSIERGCFRCDEMRPQVEALAERFTSDVEVCRVNLNHERALTAELAITVCPTYVVFNRGQEVWRTSYPTSADMLVAQVETLKSEE